jgi:hypothetical protein
MGSMTDDLAGSGRLTLTLAGEGVLSGSWQFAGASVAQAGSLFSSALDAARRSFGMTCGTMPGQGSLVLGLTLSGNTASGSYLSAGCPGLAGGSVQLIKQ